MGTVGSNPSNPLYPVLGTTPPVLTSPLTVTEKTDLPESGDEGAEAVGAEKKATPTTEGTATPVLDVTPDLKISKEMAAALSGSQVQSLIDGILADGTVDKLDDAKLKQLNILLDAAAKKDDGKVDVTEDSILDALDSRGMFGTNREVVKTNLQALKKHSDSANSLDFSGGIKLTTQDGVSGFFGGKQQRALTLIDIPEPADTTEKPATTPTSGQNTVKAPGASGTQSSSETAPKPTLDPLEAEKTISRDTRTAYYAETVNQHKANETALKSDINYMKAAFDKLPDAVIAKDITALVEHSGTQGSDLAYIKTQLENWKITLPEGVKSDSPQDIKRFLAGYEPTSENISAYRANISQVADTASKENPLTGTALSDTKKYLYDKNYIFENKEGVSEADYQRYSQFKTSLLDYQDSESKVRGISRNESSSTSNVEVENKLLTKYSETAVTEIQQAATQLNSFLKQVETKPNGKDTFGVSSDDIASLRNQLGDIVEVNAQGQMVLDDKGQPKVKQPITQEHLSTLNKVWASAEAIGMAAKLDREPGEITESFFETLRQKTGTQAGLNQWNEIQKKPAGEILTLKPELAQYADLLKQIEANPALKAALFSSENPEEAVNQLLAEHNTAVFNDSFGSFSSLWNIGPTSFLTSWGCSLPGVQDLDLCKGISSQTSLVDATLPLTLSLSNKSPLSMSSPLLSSPATSGKLDLGKYTTQDVRALLDLLKDPAQLEDQSDDDAAAAISKQQLLRGKLSEHSGEIANFINETPELAGLRQQLDAKESFDKAFWGGNSELEQARQGVKSLLEKQDRVGADLAVAEAQIKATLEDQPEGELRNALTEKLLVVQNAQAELKSTGKMYSQGDSSSLAKNGLQSVMNSLAGKGIASEGRSAEGIGKNLIADTQAEQMLLTLDKTLKTLAEINANPQQKQAILDKFPEQQRNQVSNLLDNHTLLEDIRKQMATDPSSIDPSTMQAFGFAGYMTDLAQNGTPEQIKAALEVSLPGFSLKVSDAIDHMDRLLTHVNSLGIDDGQLKATYVTGLSAYFNEVFENNPSVDQAWQALDNKETMNNVQQSILRGVYEDSGMSSAEVDALLSGQSSASGVSAGEYSGRLTEQTKIIDDFLGNQQSTLKSIVDRGGRTQGNYESLLMDYTSLEASRNPKTGGTAPSYNKQAYESLQTRLVDREAALSQRQRSGANFSVDERQELADIKGLLAATRASIHTEDLKVLEVGNARGINKGNQLLAVIGKTSQAVMETATESETLVDTNKDLFNQHVPAVTLSNGEPMLDANGEPMTGQAFVASMLGAGGATPQNMEIFELNFGRLQDTKEGELLYQKTLVQARSNEYAQLSHNVTTSNSNDPNNAKIYAFGQSLQVGQGEVNKLITGPKGLDALGAWNEIIQKHGERLKSGHGFDDAEYARDLSKFAERFGITDLTFMGYANGTSFRADEQDQKGAQLERAQMNSVEKGIVEKAIETATTEIETAMATVSDLNVTMDISMAPGFKPEEHSGFTELLEGAKHNMARSATERLDGILAVEDILNRDTARIVTEAHESGDFSLLNQVQQMQSEALQRDMERSDSVKLAMSELTGTPFTPHSDRYRAAEGVGKTQGANASEQKASQLVEEANQLASRLVLAPKGEDSEAFLNQLVTDFINVIRDQDYKTRQLLMAQLANQMMTDSITNFYKDKTDKNNKYHQDSLNQISESFQRNIQRSIQDSLVSSAAGGDAQSVAAVSGQVGAASTADAMGVAQLRASAEQLLSQAQQMEPPLLSDLQKDRILDSLFDRNPDNDALGIMALAGLHSLN